MATPTSNSIAVSGVDSSSTGVGRYLIYGSKWGGGMGQGVTLTYSFPTTTGHHITNYSSDNEWDSWASLSTGERTAIRDVLAVWASFANLGFVEVADNATTVGELRFTYSGNVSTDAAAHAYFPVDHPSAGDVWFSWENFNPNANASILRGTYDYHTILHEVGHALGLKHPFDAPNVIPAAQDNCFYTIMSYTASPWSASGDSDASFYPTTPMYYDLVAIEALYGRNTSANAGNTTYTFNDGSYYWQAINDGSGADTIVYNGSEGTKINLNPGEFSSLSEAISFGSGGSSRDTVTIGPGVVIENATGGSGNDTLTGNGAANALNGGAGADQMRGGAGNDVYRVDNANDIVDESVAGSNGIDTVQSAISFNLANISRVLGSVEYLTLLGTAAINGTGNGLANVITGNSAANVLNGGAGADQMRGGAGNDVYQVDNANDIVDESVAGSNGTDTVQSAISFNLANSSRVLGAVEYLTLIGTAAINGTGNGLTNVINGNSAANVLNGGAGNDILQGGAGNDTLIGGVGADRMRGGAGNDIYRVDNAGDVVDEGIAGSDGIDTVQSAVSFNLGYTARAVGSVEYLTLLGTAAIYGVGNSLANVMNGNSAANSLNGGDGNDILNGGLGNDTLVGGAGKDTFLFNTALGAANVDTIGSFVASDDGIRLENAIFTGLTTLGALAATAFVKNMNGLAQDADDRIIYDTDSGSLFYDSNGSAGGGSVQFARLSPNLALTNVDFFVI